MVEQYVETLTSFLCFLKKSTSLLCFKDLFLPPLLSQVGTIFLVSVLHSMSLGHVSALLLSLSLFCVRRGVPNLADKRSKQLPVRVISSEGLCFSSYVFALNLLNVD